MLPLVVLLALAGTAACLVILQKLRRLQGRLGLVEHRLDAHQHRFELLERANPAWISPVEPASPAAPFPPEAERPAPSAPPSLPPVIARPTAFESGFSAAARPTAPASPHSAPTLPPAPVPFPTPRPAAPRPSVDWEKFMGIRLFAWLGGLALFLGIAYFVKYSFERNLIPPSARVAIGILTGFGLVGGGHFLRRREYAVTAQTLCATGLVVLYAALFAGHHLYHLPWLPTGITFAAMSGVTVMAFVLATRTQALVVALLGLLGGFLTPILLAGGGDQPLALFGYVALLDAGLLAVALRCRWHFLPVLGAVATALLQFLWVGWDLGPDRGPLALVIFSGFILLFAVGLALAQWRPDRDAGGDWLGGALGIAAATTLLFAGGLLLRDPWSARPGLLFAFVLAADLGFLAAAWWRPRMAPVQVAAGVLAFAYLTAWMTKAQASDLLAWSILLSLGFAALHVAFPLILARRNAAAARTATMAAQWFPPLALLALLVPLIRLETPSFALWPAILLLDLAALALAAWAAGVVGAIAALLLGLVSAGLWIGRLPPEATGLGGTLAVLTATSVLFVTAGAAIARVTKSRSGPAVDPETSFPGPVPAQLPVLAALLPFLSLAQIFGHLRLADPSAVFAATAILALLLFGLTAWLRVGALPLAGMVGLALVEHTWWWSARETPPHPALAILWIVGFLAVWATAPLWPKGRLGELRLTWVAAALIGLPQFHLVYRIVERLWPNEAMGLLPLAFAMPPGLTLAWLVRRTPATDPNRLERLAWFGGITLFFITVALPIQFERQWLTLGLALEGAAVLGLFRRVPHPGLRLVGLGLLLTVFLRLMTSPGLTTEHIRGAYPLWNVWLYTHGLGALAMFVGARLLRRDSGRVFGIDARAVLVTFGTVLLFVLLNLQIADLFTTPGDAVRFEFGGNLGRDMTYTIAWALFALGLVVAGLNVRSAACRWAGLGLLSVAIVKLFLNDLSRLDHLYRVGALIGVALVALASSMLYQRFVARDDRRSSIESAGPTPPER